MTTIEPRTTFVESADGTRIAVFVAGSGRPLVMVHGTTADHTTWRMLTPVLASTLSVHALDRRGRGASGDHDEYAIEREYADLASVVDAAAGSWGGPVDLLAHSYGGTVAFGAALRTRNLRRLALYEGWPVPNAAHRTVAPAVTEALDSLLAQGRPEEMLEMFYRDVGHLSEEEIAFVKGSAAWPARVAAAGTVPRELRAFSDEGLDGSLAARIMVPVLLLVGGDSPAEAAADPETVAAALPNARVVALEGQMHLAHLVDPEGFAQALLAFLEQE